MSILQFTDEPLYAGATWNWTESLDDYPASDGWSLVIHLKHGTDTTTTLTSDVSGDDFDFSISAADTKAYTKRNYIYQAVASKTGEVDIVEEGEVEIYPLLTIANDLRTDNEIILDAIVSALKGRASREQEEIEFAGRKIKYLSIKDLTDAKKHFENEVKKERRLASGKQGTPQIKESY